MTRKIEADARGTLFDVLDDTRTGMLGVIGSDSHMQPMSHFADRNAGEVWFITSSQTDLVREIGPGAHAHYCVTAPDGTFYACLDGRLEQREDRARLDELWSAVTAAWFEAGRDDPEVTLLRLTLRTAGVWTATDSSVMFGLEIARANLSAEHKPDIGDHRVIRFGSE